MRISLRYKFVLALLASSIVSIALVVGVASLRLAQKFDDLVLENASQNFRLDVAAYFRTYGSWEEAQKHEIFPAFATRRRQKLGLPIVSGPKTPIWSAGNTEVELEPLTSTQALARPEDLGRPPFLFYLFDAERRALLPLAPYAVGDPLDATRHAKVSPIHAGGRLVAYHAPEGKINYSDLDLGYLAAVREAMLYGALTALALALILGMSFGSQLSAALRRLTSAIRAMGAGQLRQQVPVDAGDEIGVLADAFNRMSDELARNNEELRKTQEKMQLQAQQLRELTVRDDLTRLHNRRYFDEQGQVLFNLSLRYERPFSIVLGDIDFFKAINDRFSHATGDEVLRRLGAVLREQVREVDIAVRYGGEEFLIAFPETSLPQAVAVSEKLRQYVEDYPWARLHPELRVTMSMGVFGDRKVGSLAAMVTAADALLYRAKSQGRNRVCF